MVIIIRYNYSLSVFSLATKLPLIKAFGNQRAQPTDWLVVCKQITVGCARNA